MNDNKNLTTPETATTKPETTTKPATPVKEKDRVHNSMQFGVPTCEIKRKSVLELRREFGENWV